MESELASSSYSVERVAKGVETDSIRVKRKTLQAVLEQCQKALELLGQAEESDGDGDDGAGSTAREEERNRERSFTAEAGDLEADELCDLIKSRVESHGFLEKIECARVSVPYNIAEEGSSWDLVGEDDVWGGESIDSDEDYILVREEDIVDGVACFMAAYLLSLKQTKDLTPNQLQEALTKTFSVKKRKGKLRKAWDGSKVIYNVASWGATAIGIYQNPVILRVASKAFWTSCNVVSKLL